MTKNGYQSRITMQMTRYLEAESIKRQLGESIAQQCYSASTVQEINEALPKPIKIPAQFQDDRQFAADRVHSQYVEEVRKCYSYVSKQYDPVLRDREQGLDKTRTSFLKQKAKEDEIRRAEMEREMELDLKRHELLKKKEREKSRKKGSKKENEHSVEKTESDHINRTSDLAKKGKNMNTCTIMTQIAPAPPTFEKPKMKTNVANEMRTRARTPPTQGEQPELESLHQRIRRRHNLMGSEDNTVDMVPAPPLYAKPDTCNVRRHKFVGDGNTPEKNAALDLPSGSTSSTTINTNTCLGASHTNHKSLQDLNEELKAKQESELSEAEIRMGCGGISYLIDTNTFRPSTSRREITRAHKEVVTGQFRRHEKPAVMSWNATTAKMKVGFKSKLRKEQDQASFDKT
ncbi:hypothetical protein DPMN_097492 [Dreissena polymorpha]|uniref:Uncharacterized protein n=2 Tax=Dreissena polymorpha TaxID=45954 RepID=A0A9D4LB81_DREPO|nr:hypothetical protein DPMN_097492 [Dreissena polymorpha]